ncbi:NAD-dependent epimerase/dehydratase family protein [Dactylosporangium sp. CS-047395]|uniref:NAD-dependent epimerase/dehydratase family protein n=1 Tax=Dactylosporangium sp. CS-047395 TaxID=3239936 RepID=UPI003D89D735
MILVTGGYGFIGAHTTRALLDLGAPALPASRNPRLSALLPAEVAATTLDCTDPQSLAGLGRRHHITTIVHLAAAPLGGGTALEELDHNTAATVAVLRAAAGWQVERVVLASTIGVYAGVEHLPWREDAPLPLASPHPIPASKKIAEILALASGLEVVVARIGGIWGPGGRPSSPFMAAPGLVHAAAAQIRAGAATSDTRAAAVHTSGADLLYARDCGAALAMLATAPVLEHRVYNVGGGRPTTNGEVVAAIAKVRPEVRPALPDGGHGPVPYLDTTRLRAAGWAPEWPLDRAVADYLDWLAAGHER